MELLLGDEFTEYVMVIISFNRAWAAEQKGEWAQPSYYKPPLHLCKTSMSSDDNMLWCKMLPLIIYLYLCLLLSVWQSWDQYSFLSSVSNTFPSSCLTQLSIHSQSPSAVVIILTTTNTYHHHYWLIQISACLCHQTLTSGKNCGHYILQMAEELIWSQI